MHSPLGVHVQEGANNQGEFGFDDEQVTGHGWCRWRESKEKDSPFPPPSLPSPAWESPPHSPSSLPPPRVLTPNIVQTDDSGHHYLPCRPECPLSQLLIGSDTWGVGIVGSGKQVGGEEWAESLGTGAWGNWL